MSISKVWSYRSQRQEVGVNRGRRHLAVHEVSKADGLFEVQHRVQEAVEVEEGLAV